jgi:hypothetical protein
MNGETVDPANYEVREGSTIIELKAEYLDTLKSGEYVLTVAYTNGSVDCALTVEGSGSAWIWVLVSVLIVAVLGAGGFCYWKFYWCRRGSVETTENQ